MAKPEKRRPFKDGYYIEVHNSGDLQPVFIHRETEQEILRALQNYRGNKLVKYLGKAHNGLLPSCGTK